MTRIATAAALLAAIVSPSAALGGSNHVVRQAKLGQDRVSFTVALSHYGKPAPLSLYLHARSPKHSALLVAAGPLIWKGKVGRSCEIRFDVPLSTFARVVKAPLSDGIPFAIAGWWSLSGATHFSGTRGVRCRLSVSE